MDWRVGRTGLVRWMYWTGAMDILDWRVGHTGQARWKGRSGSRNIQERSEHLGKYHVHRPTEKWKYPNKIGLKRRQTWAIGKDERVLGTRYDRTASYCR
jgi:hypothetical protein